MSRGDLLKAVGGCLRTPPFGKRGLLALAQMTKGYHQGINEVRAVAVRRPCVTRTSMITV